MIENFWGVFKIKKPLCTNRTVFLTTTHYNFSLERQRYLLTLCTHSSFPKESLKVWPSLQYLIDQILFCAEPRLVLSEQIYPLSFLQFHQDLEWLYRPPRGRLGKLFRKMSSHLRHSRLYQCSNMLLCRLDTFPYMLHHIIGLHQRRLLL